MTRPQLEVSLLDLFLSVQTGADAALVPFANVGTPSKRFHTLLSDVLLTFPNKRQHASQYFAKIETLQRYSNTFCNLQMTTQIFFLGPLGWIPGL